MSRAGKKRSIPVREQAAEWLVAFDDGEIGLSEKRTFLDWLKQSPDHIKEFMQLSALHVELTQNERLQSSIDELVAAAKSEVIEFEPASETAPARDDKESEPQAHIVTRRWMGVAATLLIGILTAVWVGRGAQTGHIYRTELGEQRSIALEDGSMITLNTLSEVRVTLTERSRQVKLIAGEALFDVARDPARPFYVDAGPMRLTVVGTRFNVYRQSEQTVLTVVEGRVAVATTSVPPAGNADPSAESRLLANAGDQVAVAVDGSGVTRAEIPAAEASTAWTERKLVFEDRPLADVAEEFNRYNRLPIKVDDPELGSRRITGVFNAHDAELLGTFLGNQPGIEVQRDSTGIHIRQRRK
ncbi:MAG: FecR family protein [Sphingomonadales bacterium]|nr:FecR family protein [Sphingomonadales bacterium]